MGNHCEDNVNYNNNDNYTIKPFFSEKENVGYFNHYSSDEEGFVNLNQSNFERNMQFSVKKNFI